MNNCEYCDNKSNINVTIENNDKILIKNFCSNCFNYEKGIKKSVKKLKNANQYKNMECDCCHNKADICYGLGYVEIARGDVLAYCKKCFIENYS